MTAYIDKISRPPRTLTDREQRLLLKVTGLRRDGYRDHMIFSLALGTGLREHEILALDIGDVFDSSGDARRRVQLRVFKRSNPDRLAQQVILPETMRAKLKKFYRWKRQEEQSLFPDAPLFISRKNNRLSARQLRHSFKLWQERAGFDRSFRFHSLRHCAITSVYERTKNILVAQRFARHRSITSTQIYMHPSDETLARAVQDLLC